MPPCVSLPRLPPQPACAPPPLIMEIFRRLLCPPAIFLPESWSHGKILADDSFHVACPSTRLTSLPHSSAHTFFFVSSHLCLDLTAPHPLSWLLPVWTSFCLPFQTPSQTLSYPPHNKCQNSPKGLSTPVECVIVTQSLQKQAVLGWHLVTRALRGWSLRK